MRWWSTSDPQPSDHQRRGCQKLRDTKDTCTCDRNTPWQHILLPSLSLESPKSEEHITALGKRASLAGADLPSNTRASTQNISRVTTVLLIKLNVDVTFCSSPSGQFKRCSTPTNIKGLILFQIVQDVKLVITLLDHHNLGTFPKALLCGSETILGLAYLKGSLTLQQSKLKTPLMCKRSSCLGIPCKSN